MNATNLKFVSAAGLFLLWTGLLVARVPNCGDLVEAIKAALLSLGVFHAAMAQPAPTPVFIPQPPAPPAPTTTKELP